MSALTFPLLGPLMITVMLSVVSSEEEIEGPLEVPVIGVEYAPNLVRFLEEQGVVLEPPTEEMIDDPHGVVRNGDEAVIVEISEDYAEDFEQVDLLRLHWSPMSQNVVHKLRCLGSTGFLVDIAHKWDRLRLLLRGVSPQVMRPLNIHKKIWRLRKTTRLRYFRNDRDVFDYGCFRMQHVHCD